MKHITKLLLISPLFFNPVFAEEIEDFQRAKYCFALEDSNTAQNKDLESTKIQLAQKQKSQDAYKIKLDKEMTAIKAQQEMDKKKLSRWESENKKFTQEELALGGLKQKVSSLQTQVSENTSNAKKFQCNDKYSEEAVEKICIIDKKTSAGCARQLSGPMKHLKE